MATKIEPKITETPPIQTSEVTPAAPGPVKTGIAAREATPPPAPAFQSGTPGLQGKFAYAPSIRAGAFANSPGHKIGLNRPTKDILGPGSIKTVGELAGQLEELDPDMRLLEGAFNVLG